MKGEFHAALVTPAHDRISQASHAPDTWWLSDGAVHGGQRHCGRRGWGVVRGTGSSSFRGLTAFPHGAEV